MSQASFIQTATRACKKARHAETAPLTQRNERAADEDDPMVHYGLVASTNLRLDT
jgi:hypothetical protein